MENERLTFEQVCERYEFADWELAELVEQGEIVPDEQQLFTPDEILRFLHANPRHFFSLEVASHLCGRAHSTLKEQAKKGRLKAKKISDRWATNAKSLETYMERRSRRI